MEHLGTWKQQDAVDEFLDRPLISGTKITVWWGIYGLILLFIIWTRLWDLAPRAYSHDESIHAWESWKLLTGQGYAHSPVYHGPFLYHFTALIFALFGHNDFTGRLSPALFGIALTVLPVLLKPWLGKKGVLAATLLMAISPVMMHRSRFLRHDPYVAVFNLLLVVGVFRYLARRRTGDLYLIAAAVSLGLCAKETTFITYFIVGTFLAAMYGLELFCKRGVDWDRSPLFDLIIVIGTLILPLASPFAIKLLGGDPLDYSQTGILFSAAIFLAVLALSVGIGMWWDPHRWLTCAAIFYLIFVPLFTTMFTNGKGIATGMVGQLGYWLSQHGVARGGQPWFYYLVLMPMYEFLPLLLGWGGIFFLLIRGRRLLERLAKPEDRLNLIFFLAYWSLMAFVLYSWAGEKMPWLTMHLALPLQLLAGWTLGQLLGGEWTRRLPRRGLLLLVLMPLLVYGLCRLAAQGPSKDTSLDTLGRTMAWGVTAMVVLIIVVWIVRIWRQVGSQSSWRLAALSGVLFLAALTVRFAWMATFINGDVATEFLVYAQGSPDVALVARELEAMSKRLTGGLHLKIAYDDETSWPFVWYLREYDNAQYYGKKPAGPFDADVVLVGLGNEGAVKPFLGNRYDRREYRLIWWPNQDLYMRWTPRTFWEDIKDRETRKKLWQVFFYRRYDVSLTNWPYVSKFAMYVRRDVLRDLWDYGPDALRSAAARPEDAYLEKWQPLTADEAWGGIGAERGQLLAPKGLAVDAEGNVYVADSQNHRIQVFDTRGHPLRTWGREGALPGEFKEPWGVAVSPDGLVYVADTWNHRIQVFEPDGTFLRMWGTFGEAPVPSASADLLYGPRDLAFDSQGYLYIADTGNKRILKCDPQGRLIAAVGGAGSEPGQFQEPVGIAFDANDLLYVADTWNQRIQVLDRDLKYVRSWQVCAWDGMSVVNKPYLAIDRRGSVWATDPEGYRLLRFASDGALLATYGQYGSDLSAMDLPTGIAIDQLGRVLVSDSNNHRILVFGGLAD